MNSDLPHRLQSGQTTAGLSRVLLLSLNKRSLVTASMLTSDPNAAKGNELGSLFTRQLNDCIMFRKCAVPQWSMARQLFPPSPLSWHFTRYVAPKLCAAIVPALCNGVACSCSASGPVRTWENTGSWQEARAAGKRFLSWGEDDECGRVQPQPARI